MQTFTKGFISIVATTAIVTGLVYAATTINTVTIQTINSGSIMGAGWFQDVNDKVATIRVGSGSGTVKFNKIQLGEKVVLSGVGDPFGNDEWIRMLDVNTNGSNFGNKGFAASKLWAKDMIYTDVRPSYDKCPTGWNCNLQVWDILASSVKLTGGVFASWGNFSGNIYTTEKIGVGTVTPSHAVTVHREDYALVARNGDGLNNSAAKSPVGSLFVNDVYLRSAGKWASEMGGATQTQNSGALSGGTCNLTESQTRDLGCPVGSALSSLNVACGEDQCGGGYNSASCRYFDGSHLGQSGSPCYTPTNSGPTYTDCVYDSGVNNYLTYTYQPMSDGSIIVVSKGGICTPPPPPVIDSP